MGPPSIKSFKDLKLTQSFTWGLKPNDESVWHKVSTNSAYVALDGKSEVFHVDPEAQVHALPIVMRNYGQNI